MPSHVCIGAFVGPQFCPAVVLAPPPPAPRCAWVVTPMASHWSSLGMRVVLLLCVSLGVSACTSVLCCFVRLNGPWRGAGPPTFCADDRHRPLRHHRALELSDEHHLNRTWTVTFSYKSVVHQLFVALCANTCGPRLFMSEAAPSGSLSGKPTLVLVIWCSGVPLREGGDVNETSHQRARHWRGMTMANPSWRESLAPVNCNVVVCFCFSVV